MRESENNQSKKENQSETKPLLEEKDRTVCCCTREVACASVKLTGAATGVGAGIGAFSGQAALGAVAGVGGALGFLCVWFSGLVISHGVSRICDRLGFFNDPEASSKAADEQPAPASPSTTGLAAKL